MCGCLWKLIKCSWHSLTQRSHAHWCEMDRCGMLKSGSWTADCIGYHIWSNWEACNGDSTVQQTKLNRCSTWQLKTWMGWVESQTKSQQWMVQLSVTTEVNEQTHQHKCDQEKVCIISKWGCISCKNAGEVAAVHWLAVCCDRFSYHVYALLASTR